MSRSDRSWKDAGTLVTAFAGGALLGAIVALLLAPGSGVDTRRRLGHAARRLAPRLRGVLEAARPGNGSPTEAG